MSKNKPEPKEQLRKPIRTLKEKRELKRAKRLLARTLLSGS